MAVYLITSIITSINMHLSIKCRYKIIRILNTIFGILIPSIIYSIRYGIGTDYFNYASAFKTLQYTGFEGRFEWAYVSINLLVGKLDGNLESVFFITAVIMFIFLREILKEHSNILSPGIITLTYMLIYYQMSFNLVRNSVAILICLYSYRFIKERSLLKFILVVILASGFHNSALLVIPLYFFYNVLGKKTRIVSRISLYVITALSVFFLDKALIRLLQLIPKFSYYTFYIEGSANEISFVPLLIQLPFILLGIIPFIVIGKKDKNFSFLYSTYIISVLLKLSRFVGTQYLDRISLNYEIALILLTAYYISYFNKKKEFIMSFIILGYMFAYWYFVYIFMGNHGTFPYQWIF